MAQPITSGLLIAMASACLFLGALVVAHNHRMRVNWAFGALSMNLALWGLGVLLILESQSLDVKTDWIRNTFIIATFFPVTFYWFIGCFPRGKFTGSRIYLYANFFTAPLLIAGSFSPLYMNEVTVNPNTGRPLITYGPVFYVYVLQCVIMFFVMHWTLFRKLWRAEGLDSRQLQYVLLGIFGSAFLGTFTNILLPAFNVDAFQRYGPIFFALMLAIFAYAMIRYHLMEMRVLAASALANVATAAFVVGTFLAVMALGALFMEGPYPEIQVMPTVMSALIIAVAFQAVRNRVQKVLDRTLLKRRYETGRLLAKVSSHSSRLIRLDELLKTVARDIRKEIGASLVRVMLVDEQNPDVLITKYSAIPEEQDAETARYGQLVRYMRRRDRPVLLEQLVRQRPSPTNSAVAADLAELDAYLCAPLRTNTGLIGLLLLGQKNSHDMYGEQDEMAFTALAGPLGAAIENSRLYQKVDSLNAHLSRVLSAIREGVIVVNEKGHVTTVNESARRMLGELAIGDHVDDIKEEIAKLIRVVFFEDRAIPDHETELQGPGGEKIPVVLSAAPLKTSSGTSTGAIAMIFDLSQVKHLEANVIRAERLSSIGTLAAGMAHEIKNPLVSIKTFTQLLLSRYEDEDFRLTFADIVPQEVDRIDGIVSRLLDFARPKPVEFRMHNICEVIRKVLALIENQIRSARIKVETELPEGGIYINGDEQQLHQLFLNLFLNAIEAMEDNDTGTLKIWSTCGRMVVNRSNGSDKIDADCVRIYVQDSGSGISEEDMQHLFTPFFTTKLDGSGLGLAVVHGIMEDHGGEIDVKSGINEGTTFVVTFPLAEDPSTVVPAE